MSTPFFNYLQFKPIPTTHSNGNVIKDDNGNVIYEVDNDGNVKRIDTILKRDSLVKDSEGKSLFDAAGSATAAAAQALTDAKDYADGLADNYDAAGTAAGLNTAMDARVKALEEIDHEQLAADASAAAVAAIVAGAESDFDTLKEVADWINSDTTGAAALQIKVAENADAITDLTNDKQDSISDLETIRSGAAAGATALQADDLAYATNDDIDGLFA